MSQAVEMVEDRLTEEQIGQILQLFVDAGLPAAFEGEGEEEEMQGGDEEDAGMMEEEGVEDGGDGQEDR